MNKEKAKRIFDKYNPASEIVRCPRGKAPVRNMLHIYARAAVNLYGVIRVDEFVDIINDQNDYQTNKEEIYTLLLPFVIKYRMYGFYKDCIVHYWFLDDFDQAEIYLDLQKDKPRYIPVKEEFIKYVDEDYEDNDHWFNVRKFFFRVFGYSKNTSDAFYEIRDYMVYGDGIRELGPILGKHDLMFNEESQVQEFFDLIMTAKNNTRIWENNGHTPYEMHEIFQERQKNIIQLPTIQRKEVGRNNPCPCGSGKKYKKCCGEYERTRAAQLSFDECKLFYEIWYGLLEYVNEKCDVIKGKNGPASLGTISDAMLYRVRDVLWENPELIDEYIKESDLSQEKVDILKLWKTNHKKGDFVLWEYQPEYAVVFGADEEGKDRLYGIKGISKAVANALMAALPVPIATVLLPFKGKIIYDGYIGTWDISFGEGAMEMFRGVYDRAIMRGIITSLE